MKNISNLESKKIIYKFLINNFIKEIKKDKLDLHVILNLRNYIFEKSNSDDYCNLFV